MGQIAKDYISKELNTLPNYISVATFQYMDRARILPLEKLQVEAALDYIARLNDNWNGEGAIAPTEQSVEAARAFINNYMLNKKYPNEVSPDGDGAILFVWKISGIRTSMTIEASLIHISVEYSDGGIALPDSVPYDLHSIPKEVLKYIP